MIRRALFLAAGLLLLAGPAAAHPLGNATVNRQSALTVEPGRVRLDFRMDMAEIPSLAAEAEADANGDGTADPAEWRRQARHWAAAAGAALHLAADGRPLAWRLESAEHELAAGEAGLPLLRLHARYAASLPAGARRLELSDDFRPADRGWREIWAAAAGGVELAGAVARADRSQGLRRYPADPPLPDERHAGLSLRLPPPAAAAGAPGAADADRVEPSAPAPAEPAAIVPSRVEAEARGTEVAAPATEADTPPAPGMAAMFRLGVHHILGGFDHLAFLAGLLLLAGGWRAAAGVVSAFTLAHSLTLFLAASGRVAAPPDFVEPAIALTVAWVGAMALAGRGRAHGFGLAFGFGLVHGLGFAGALAESLGGGEAVPLLPLLAFNLGIEACQLVLVAAVLGTVAVARRTLAPARRLASLAVTASGLAWFAARVAG